MQHQCLKCLATNELPDGYRFNACTHCGAIQTDAELQIQTALTAAIDNAKSTATAATRSATTRPFLRFCWLITLLCCLVVTMLLMLSTLTAPIAAALIIIPYVFSRAVEGLTKP